MKVNVVVKEFLVEFKTPHPHQPNCLVGEMDSEASGSGEHLKNGKRNPSVDVTKRVDDLFSATSHDPHDLEDWLAALREAAGMKLTTDTKKIAETEDGGMDVGPNLSQRGSRTRLSLPEQLDYTLLEHFRKLQPAPDESYKEEPKGHYPVERGVTEPNRPLQRHSAGEIHRISLYNQNHQTEPSPPPQFFRDIWTHNAQQQMQNGQDFLHKSYPLPPPAYYMLRSGCRPKTRRTYAFFCAFCFKNKEHLQMVTSHCLYFPKSSIVWCPVLRNYVCRRCGGTGDAAHTDSYCPLKSGKGTPKISIKGQPKDVAKSSGTPKKQVASHWYQDNFPPLT